MSRPRVFESDAVFRAHWYQVNKERLLAKSGARSKTPRGKYDQQKAHAKRRGIAWEISFDEWWGLWEESGKWAEREARQYVMCRTEDQGPYKIGNVRIDTQKNNVHEYWRRIVD